MPVPDEFDVICNPDVLVVHRAVALKFGHAVYDFECGCSIIDSAFQGTCPRHGEHYYRPPRQGSVSIQGIGGFKHQLAFRT